MRNKSLDGLRGIAAFSILLYHYARNFKDNYGYEGDWFINFYYLQYGTEVLCLLSGFFIYKSINRYSANTFVSKRFKRIYPTYFLCCVISYLVISTSPFGDYGITFKDFLINLSLLQRWFFC